MGNEQPESRGRSGNRLFVIALWVGAIWLIAVIILPMLAPPFREQPISRVKVDISELATAITSYQADYQHWPCDISDTNGDVTFGISADEIKDFRPVAGTRVVASNTDSIVVLMDLNQGVNTGHRLNPRQTRYLNARINGEKGPGVWTNDFQFRDPWGNPYVISLAANGDGVVRDACYRG